jgi:hypothetical protein
VYPRPALNTCVPCVDLPLIFVKHAYFGVYLPVGSPGILSNCWDVAKTRAVLVLFYVFIIHLLVAPCVSFAVRSLCVRSIDV